MKPMKKYTPLVVLVLLALSCNLGKQPPGLVAPTATMEQPAPLASSTAAELSGTNCASEDVNNLIASIAEDYSFTSTEEITTWFCNGADLEDIMVALATEDETGTPAEDMLAMRAEGLTWEEIWQTVGLSQ